MTYHRFKVGQVVGASEFGIPPGPYQIIRLLPLANGMPQYRVVSIVDSHNRVLREAAIRTLAGPRRASPVREA